jgi:hypothetical protein
LLDKPLFALCGIFHGHRFWTIDAKTAHLSRIAEIVTHARKAGQEKGGKLGIMALLSPSLKTGVRFERMRVRMVTSAGAQCILPLQRK